MILRFGVYCGVTNRMRNILLAIKLLAILLVSSCSENNGEFESEYALISKSFNCKSTKILPKDELSGRLYGCTGGVSETLRIYISEDDGSVDNIRFIWSDWVRSIGEGTHMDKGEAREWVVKMAGIYYPEGSNDVLVSFFSEVNSEYISQNHVIEYKFKKGVAANEHLLVITPVSTYRRRLQKISDESLAYGKCLEATAKVIGYSSLEISGDGLPVKENGYSSFLLKGRGKDLFFCEFHSDGSIKVKAAINGKYPFKYIK